jgi:hypothetical protein
LYKFTVKREEKQSGNPTNCEKIEKWIEKGFAHVQNI